MGYHMDISFIDTFEFADDLNLLTSTLSGFKILIDIKKNMLTSSMDQEVVYLYLRRGTKILTRDVTVNGA